MVDSSTIQATDISRPVGLDPWVVFQLQWRGYLLLELRQAQQDAKDHERAAQVAQQRAAELRKQIAALPEG